jgi:hypothetical protein
MLVVEREGGLAARLVTHANRNTQTCHAPPVSTTLADTSDAGTSGSEPLRWP